MASLTQFEALVRRARTERAPAPDVAAAVLRRLRTPQPAPIGGEPLGWMWATSTAMTAATVLVAALTYFSWLEFNGTMSAWVTEVSQWGIL
jgi:hypothetical protein